MLYLVIDPKVFILSESEIMDIQYVNQFLARLVRWADYADTFDIEFGITNLCRSEMVIAKTSIFNPEFLDELVQRFPQYLDDMVMVAFQPLLENLQNNIHLDQAINHLSSSEFDYEVEEVLLSPKEHLDRLSPTPVRDTFLQMLGIIVFARKQQILPLSDLINVRLLTTYSSQEQKHWAHESQYRLLVHIHFGWVLGETIADYQTLEALTDYNDEFETLFSPELLENVAEKRQFSSVINAVQAACDVYPKRLVFTAEALEIARTSNFPDKIKIYRLIKALAEIWMPAYLRGGEEEANILFYNNNSHRITGEGKQVNRDPKFRSEREGTYNGEVIYAELHIKLAGGTRIYFAPYRTETEGKIILTRVGKHPSSAKF